MMTQRCQGNDVNVFATPLAYCTDNAAMVAGLGAMLLDESALSGREALELDAYANLRVGTPRSGRRRPADPR